jgi:septum formation protein
MDHQECSGTFRTRRPLILASASPRRHGLLRSLGLEFRTLASDVQELGEDSGLAPESLALENSRLKALDISSRNPDSYVLGADTIVVLEGRILGKPRDVGHAVAMLRSLSGRWHRVITGCAIINESRGAKELFSVESRVLLADVPEELIYAYCQSGEPLDKAGSYAVQGAGAFMVKEIVGSWTNVVGLPLYEVVDRLLGLEVVEPCLDAGN